MNKTDYKTYNKRDYNPVRGNNYKQNQTNPTSTNTNKEEITPALSFIASLFANIGIAATLSALATNCLDLVGKDYMKLSAFFGQQQLISSSSFLTGGLAFASYEIASSLTKPLLGRLAPLSPLVGFAAAAAFAHFASVPIITALTFVALGIVGKNLITNKSIKQGFHYATSTATGGLIYEGGTRLVTWLTGFNAFSLGWRSAAWAGVFGGGVVLATFAVFVIIYGTALGKNNDVPDPVFFGVVATSIAASCFVAPVPILVNVIMLTSSIFTFAMTDGSKT